MSYPNFGKKDRKYKRPSPRTCGGLPPNAIFGVRALSYYLIGYIVGEVKVPKVKSSGVLVTAIASLGSFLLISLIYFILGKPGADILNYLPLALITEIVLNSLVYLIYNIIVKKIMYIPTYKI